MQGIQDAQGNVIGLRDKYTSNKINYHGDPKCIRIKTTDAEHLRFCWFEWVDDNNKLHAVMVSDILKADKKEKGNYVYEVV